MSAAALLGMLTGCSDDGPELAPVEGTVLLDGKPLEGATVLFTPNAGGRPAGGLTDADGHYALVFTQQRAGALPGEHTVRVSTFREADPDSDREGVREQVPAKYNVRTELTRSVEPHGNVLDFELDSNGKIIEPRE